MTQISKLIALAVITAGLVAGLWGAYFVVEKRGYDRADGIWRKAVAAQKLEAAGLLAAETTKVRAVEAALHDFKRKQEQEDAKNKSTVEGLYVQLRAAAGNTKRLRDPNATRCRSGSPGAEGGDSVNAGSGADDFAEADGLFSAAATELFTRLTREADIINIAYASCRLDAANVRELLK